MNSDIKINKLLRKFSIIEACRVSRELVAEKPRLQVYKTEYRMLTNRWYHLKGMPSLPRLF